MRTPHPSRPIRQGQLTGGSTQTVTVPGRNSHITSKQPFVKVPCTAEGGGNRVQSSRLVKILMSLRITVAVFTAWSMGNDSPQTH